jgi:hypothetical protein
MLDERYEAYNYIRESLPKLCPSLIPSPLWGLNLAKLAYMSIEASFAIGDSMPSLLEKIKEFWFSLNREGACIVCGSNGSQIDEDWLYFILDNQGKPIRIGSQSIANMQGIAYLRGLRLLCDSCHLAKHQGYASTQGKSDEALEHLANVNNLKLDKAKQLVGNAFAIWHKLKLIKDWTIKIGDIENFESIRRDVENTLNYMYRKGFSSDNHWLFYETRIENKRISEYMNEFEDILNKIRQKKPINGLIWLEYLKDEIINRLSAEGVKVNKEQLGDYLLYLLGMIVIDTTKETTEYERADKDFLVRRTIEELETEIKQDFIPYQSKHGKWLSFVPKDIYGKIFRRTIEALESRELAYMAKILTNPNTDRVPIIVYSPSSLIPKYIAGVAKVIKQVLNEYGLTKTKLYYKPDTYTYLNKYSTRDKTSIYIYE